MRLLQYNNDGDFSLTEFFEGDIPKKYAILSHRWGLKEVTLADLKNGNYKKMADYGKIQFCREQAKLDGLQYFWVDTCCIDKSNAVELQEAINSMFRWYRDATKCYVYLPDVSRPRADSADGFNEAWVSAFRKSEWFTRGWTLQELIAPASVDFFCKDRELLGNKVSLERHICEITGIPASALRGSPLPDFSIAERLSWAASRRTFRQEDKAYSLLGIFDVNMPLIYSEGKDKAMNRLREEIDKASRGHKREDFSVSFSLSNVFDVEHFVGRKTELAEVHKALSGDGSRRVVVLHGLGGIGKTQLSIAYAKRHKNDYSVIFWLNTKDEDTLKQSFIKVAKQISREHPSALRFSNVDTNENLDEVTNAVKAWLSLPNNTRWLMIYDNYDNLKLPGKTNPAAVDIWKYLPESYQGSVIITTRSSKVGIGRSIQIRKLGNMCDSLEILSTMSRREALGINPDAVKLAEELDGLPLALATAGAYLDQTARSFLDYLRLYKKSWARLKETSPQLSSYEDRTLYSTWQISFDNIKQRNPLSADLLRLWAYFDNQDLWFQLLRHSDSDDPHWIRELTKDDLSFDNAIRVLSNHGLVEVANSSQESTDSTGYSIHGCVHSWTIHALNQEWDYNQARLAVKFVGAHIPIEKDGQPWLIQRRLLQHAARCSHMILNSLVVGDGLEDEYHNLGLLYADQGKLVEAEQMYQRALQGYEKAWGPDHTSTLSMVNNLGVLYKNQGKLVEAEQMYQRALQGYEKAWGPDYTSMLNTVNNLAALYADQGKLVEAEQMYQRALQGKEKAWGPEHTSTLDTVNNLGNLYADQGKLDGAERMYQRALQGYQKAIGPDNIITHIPALNTICGFGYLFELQADITKAKTMFAKALCGYEQVFGPEHAKSKTLRDKLHVLDAMVENKAPVEIEEHAENVPTGLAPASTQHKLFTLRIYANSTAQLLSRTLLFLEPSRIMRLLQYNNDRDFSLTEFFEGDIPKKYAILSHRWGAEEVTFKDLTDGTSKGKAGYRKLHFCGEQARRDGLQYFWVDTCCIDKSNSTELAEAINSMFRWYRHATKCYVYLPDVSRPRINSADGSNEDWVSIFRKSEWFRRGWTLQELIAPASVDFFCKEGELLGSKASLERHICE
ncbi:hypothetical protein IFR05_016945, partial [Cadophora sp. M221]